MRVNNRIIYLLFCFLVMFTSVALAADPETAAKNAEKFGMFTIVPPLVAIILSFITKDVVLSLFLGVFSGAIILNFNGMNIFGGVVDAFLAIIGYVLKSLSDTWNAGVILQCLTIGGVIALITKMGGAKAVAEALAGKAKTAKSAQLITWLLGLFVFFDDYANSLIVGPIMRPVSDKFKVSREKLAFVIDATAAPVAGIALISTWVGYELSLIRDAYTSIGVNANAYTIFVDTIPYRFYNILILAFIVFSAVMLKDFGPMLKAERRARLEGKVIAEESNPMTSEEATDLEPVNGVKLCIWNAIIPIGVLLVAAFTGFYFNGRNVILKGDDAQLIEMINLYPYSFNAIREAFGSADASVVLFQAALLASIVAIVMGASRKIFTIKEGINIWIRGVKSLVITGIILLLAWSLSSVIKELGTAKYLVSILEGSLPAFLLPTLIFVLGAIISFATGTSYGTMGILMPLAVPLAYAINPDIPSYVTICTGAVLTGAIFGDHCSPISDTTILSSMGSACDHLDHVKTQLPYSLSVAVITILAGYIPVGLGASIYFVMPVALAATAGMLYVFGKSVETGK